MTNEQNPNSMTNNSNCSVNDKNSNEEILACFRREDMPHIHTGKLNKIIFPLGRTQAHNEKIPHIIGRVYAFSLNGKILVQQRSPNKRSHPNLFTDSASGHIRYHPDFSYEFIEEEMWRELAEEMGTQVLYGRLFDINLEEFRSGGCELAYDFVALVEEKCIPDPVETTPRSGFRTLDEFQTLLSSENFVPITKKYWNLLLAQGYPQKIIQEYQQNQSVNKDLDSFIVNHHKASRDTDLEEECRTHYLSTGAIVGRFQPFHRGHLQLVKSILKSCNKVKIGIGSIQYSHTRDNPFTFEERKIMITRVLQNEGIPAEKFELIGIPDFHDMEKWTKETIRLLEPFDIFYSNNDWTRQLMLSAGKRIADYAKFEFSEFNGTNIRNCIIKSESITHLVPTEVEKYLHEINGFQRIQQLEK